MYGAAGYEPQLEMGGFAGGSFEGINPRDLLFSDGASYAPSNYPDLSGASFMGVCPPLSVPPARISFHNVLPCTVCGWNNLYVYDTRDHGLFANRMKFFAFVHPSLRSF